MLSANWDSAKRDSEKGHIPAQAIQRDNQYPRSFVKKVTGSTLDKIIGGREIVKIAKQDNPHKIISTQLMLSYHGPSSVAFAKNLKKTFATLGSLNVYFTQTFQALEFLNIED